MRLLLIHDADEMRSHIAQQLSTSVGNVELTFWDPSRHGMPANDYCMTFDVIMLDERPGDGDGIECLAKWQRSGLNFPPRLLLCGNLSEETVRAARLAGAIGCLPKSGLTPALIASAIRDAMKRSPAQISAGGSSPVSAADASEGSSTHDQRSGRSAATLQIPGYRILGRIGSGGMARVYLAQRESDGLDVVIKVLDPRLHQDEVFRQRFTQEYAILRRLAHHNIVAIFDQALNERQGYIVMEHFPAGDLAGRIGERGLSTDIALLFLAQIARGLDVVHRAGVVHRDLKPQNILFRDDLQLAIADFGLARNLATNTRITQRGSIFATPLYMSPEQCLRADHDQRGDLYSLGAVFFEMLTGRPPYVADNAADLAFQHVHGTLPRLPSELAELQPLVSRLLAKKPEQRPGSAAELLSAIGHSR
ncbi:MAG: protein kinase domain-containing protein [Burkholderiales bacterium]